MPLLYHFTTKQYAMSILASGINGSQIPIGPNKCTKHMVVSLTSDPNPIPLIGKSLTDGSPLSDENFGYYLAANPSYQGPPPLSSNTCEARITIKPPDGDNNYRRLNTNEAKKLGFSEIAFRRFLNIGGGTLGKWWIHLGLLPAAHIIEIRTGPYPQYPDTAWP